MKISKPLKVLLGLLTLLPLPYMLVFNFVLFPRLQAGTLPFYPLFWIQGGIMSLLIGLLIFCVTQLFYNRRVPQDKRSLWAVVLVLGNMLAIPIFFWLYVWPAESAESNGS
jgi:hypothetical protein